MTPREHDTASAVLSRLLLLLPIAARGGDDGIALDEVAATLEVEARRLMRDVAELEERSYYLPPELGSQIQFASMTRERLVLSTTGEFRRPLRLTPREALALELALRVAVRGSSDGGARGSFEPLREAIVARLRSPRSGEGADPAVALGGAEAPSAGDTVSVPVHEALRAGQALRIVYRASGRDTAERRVGPIELVHAEGSWYLLAEDLEGSAGDAAGAASDRAARTPEPSVRAFRLDRMLEASVLDVPFDPSPAACDAAEAMVTDGRVLSPHAEPYEAVVIYDASIARWVRERAWDHAEDLPDGSLCVRHQVLDPEWIVRHVLGYGGAARVVEPEEVRERVRAAAGRCAGEA